MLCKTLLKLIISIAIMGLISCGNKQDDAAPVDGCSNWSMVIMDDLQAFQLAAKDFSENPTEANCISLINYYKTYLNAMKPILNCVTLSALDKRDIDKIIKEGEDDLNNYNCAD